MKWEGKLFVFVHEGVRRLAEKKIFEKGGENSE